MHDDTLEALDRYYAETSKRRQASALKAWAWFCKRYDFEVQLSTSDSEDLSRADKATIEKKVLMFTRLLARSYAYNTAKGYIADLKSAQLTWSGHYDHAFLNLVFRRTKLVLKVLAKEKPTPKEQKRPWQVGFFPRIFMGMGWSTYQLECKWDWAPFETRIVWTAMVTMHEHLLRLGEVVEQSVDSQSGRKRWTRASVSFWAGPRRIPIMESGEPCPTLRYRLTHAEIAAVPDKTSAEGRRDPYIAPVPPLANVGEAGSVLADHAWMFCAGGLLWDLFTRDPIPARMHEFVPLFSPTPAVPPSQMRFLSRQHFMRQMRAMCSKALPQIPLRDAHGRVLGGHCFRISGINAASATGANLHEVTDKGRWSFSAFAAAKGYDYMRTNFKHVSQLTRAMTAQILVAPTCTKTICCTKTEPIAEHVHSARFQ